MTTPSCKSCAFRLGNVQKDVGSDYAGTSAPQVDICTYFDMVLGSFDPEGEGALQDDDAERIASQCKAYLSQGDDAAKRVAEYLRDRDREPGALGHMGAPLGLTLPLEVKGESGQSVKRSCGGCAHFLWPEELRDNGLPTVSKQGRGAGMCVAHGKMQDAGPGARRTVAKDCGEFSYVPDSQSDEAKAYRKELLSMASHPAHLAPLLADSGVGTSLGEQSAESGPAPEREPTDAERAAGIVRFRRFFSDDDLRWVDLPVFDPDHFSPEERAKIPVAGSEGSPETYVDHANLAYRVAVAWALGETPALNGPAGTGKTMLFHWLAYELGLPFERVSITASSSVDDLAGYMELHGSSTEFVLGRIPKAWAKPCIMVIDEPNAGPPEVWQFIRPITDSAKQLVIDSNHGQVIDRDPHSFLGMAMNPAWDWRNTGVSPLADADGSRLLHVAVGYPSREDERQIILGHCARDGIEVDDSHLDALLNVAEELRNLSEEQTLQVSWGIRQQVQVARLLPYFDLVGAFRMAVTDNLEPEQAELILSQVNMVTAGMKRKARYGAKASVSTGNVSDVGSASIGTEAR